MVPLHFFSSSENTNLIGENLIEQRIINYYNNEFDPLTQSFAKDHTFYN